MHLRRRLLSWGLALLGLLIFSPPPAHAAGASGNLIVNGDAEAGGYCTDDWAAATTVPGWTAQAGRVNVMCHTAGSFGLPSDGNAPRQGLLRARQLR